MRASARENSDRSHDVTSSLECVLTLYPLQLGLFKFKLYAEYSECSTPRSSSAPPPGPRGYRGRSSHYCHSGCCTAHIRNNCSSSPPLCRYFEELQTDLARVWEDEMNWEEELVPLASTDILGNHVGAQGSGWGETSVRGLCQTICSFPSKISCQLKSLLRLSRVFGKLFINIWSFLTC